MLLALISHLSTKALDKSVVLSYFFCQSGIPGRDTATAVVKGLLHLILFEKPKLAHCLEAYPDLPKTPFALFNILQAISTDRTVPAMYIVIDALDECNQQLGELLEWISQETRNPSTKIKWLVSSRNLPVVRERIGSICNKANADLELNEPRVSRGIATFIQSKTQELAVKKGYKEELQDLLHTTLNQKAGGTFLWVALVCKELERKPCFAAKKVLAEIPSGLGPLYDRMIDQIDALESMDDWDLSRLCKSILALASIARRNLRVDEIPEIAGLPEGEFSSDEVNELIQHCGSFLVVRHPTVYFVHQSARDYLLGSGQSRVFLLGEKGRCPARMHYEVVLRCLESMSKNLRRDLCQLKHPGSILSDCDELIKRNLPPAIRYASRYWVEHLQKSYELGYSRAEEANTRKICRFVEEKFLYWMEALTVIGESRSVISLIETLHSLLRVS